MVTDTKYPPSVKAGKPILGETPEGWARESLKKHLTLEQRKVKVLDEKEYDLVTVKRSRGGVVRREHLYGKQISVKSQFSLKQGDFLISKRQIVHGACGIVPAHLDGSIVSNEYSIFTAKDSFDLTYLRYLSETLYFQQTCFHSSIGVHIEKMIFKLDNWFKWDFNLPPLPEQRKIAHILSTWDRGIATTEKLIEASKQQKKALMQQLLTGKKRLIDPETGKAFEGEWEEVRLSALSIKGKGNFTDGDWIESPYIADSGCRLIQTGNIGVGCFKNKAKKYISEASFVELKCKEVKVNDLLICRLAEPAGRACVVPDIGERKMLTSVDVTIMRVDKTKSSPEYLSYFFSLDHTLYTVTTLCGGSTRSRISRTNLGRMKIFLPALNEQQKIAAVLSAADKEIELLEAKLAHFMQEKKALMQQLLTGKRRVKVAETEAA
ncbi:restriction endonuclease subunit S [Vibrio parahaemolyticus]|uniref:restriction endonuclease subunit S n=1 Tax=unclassified Vibrio TaxID=2614977 RepID=UPI002A1011FF|nr:restriction endonuclease subunit S [Vibrio parahaemolyticus]EHY9857858.1 restriction endonuclease subunit S [Vibrio parahaemolyticus]EJC7006713.1 restriction endonuclease subunit S [Vibrio parahaemolyticus]EJC7025447.1 restriction endonuclease subunit S [Vibrio parahaemolyticus]EJC7174986.1 restriction endonuclease subunit S [Vibrio parahaemolyticus]